jgi:predicted nucleic acid-binding Zn ribbon protein
MGKVILGEIVWTGSGKMAPNEKSSSRTPKREVFTRKKDERLAGLSESARTSFIGRLNGVPLKNERGLSDESRHRIITLVRGLQLIGRLIKERMDQGEKVDFLAQEAQPRAAYSQLEVVNRLLRKYHSEPFVAFSHEASRENTKDPGNDGLGYLIQGSWWNSDFPAEEASSAALIIELLKHHKFYLLRECIVCGNWFLADRSSQRTCSSACRNREYNSRDEYKAKKREEVKKRYYAAKKAAKSKRGHGK